MKSPPWTWLKNSKVGGKRSRGVLEVWRRADSPRSARLPHYPLVLFLSAGWSEKCAVKSDQIMGWAPRLEQFVADILVLMSAIWLFTSWLQVQKRMPLQPAVMLTKYSPRKPSLTPEHALKSLLWLFADRRFRLMILCRGGSLSGRRKLSAPPHWVAFSTPEKCQILLHNLA